MAIENTGAEVESFGTVHASDHFLGREL